VIALGVGAGLALAGCGDDATTASPEQDFRERAAAAANGSWAATYDLEQASGAAASAVVTHAPGSLRLDITTAAGVSTSITTPEGTVSCQAAGKAAPKCLETAAAGATPPAALDPGLRTVFSTSLAAVGSGAGTVEVLGDRTADDADAVCARVSGEGVDEGVYCLVADGVPSSANFESGSLTLKSRGAAPTDASFVPPATPAPTL
jgi:hypothetical protein